MSANVSTLTDSTNSDPGFECEFLYWSRSGYLLDRCQNVVDLFPWRYQSLHQALWKLPGDCTRYANESPKMLIPQCWKTWKWPDHHQKLIVFTRRANITALVRTCTASAAYSLKACACMYTRDLHGCGSGKYPRVYRGYFPRVRETIVLITHGSVGCGVNFCSNPAEAGFIFAANPRVWGPFSSIVILQRVLGSDYTAYDRWLYCTSWPRDYNLMMADNTLSGVSGVDLKVEKWHVDSCSSITACRITIKLHPKSKLPNARRLS